MAPDGNKGGFGAHYPGSALASLFSCKGVFTSRVIFRQCFADRFADELDSSLRDFRFSVDEEDVRSSPYCRFSSELLLSA